MCFPKVIVDDEKDEIQPYFNQEGTINEPETIILPEGIHQHVDNPVLDDDIQDGILAFVYETSNGVHIVYTSPESQALCELVLAVNPFE